MTKFLREVLKDIRSDGINVDHVGRTGHHFFAVIEGRKLIISGSPGSRASRLCTRQMARKLARSATC